MYHSLLLLTCIASALHGITAQGNAASSRLAQLQNCKTDLLFADYFDANEETDIAASESYWRSTGAPECAYHQGQIGCEALYSNLSACSFSATPQGCFCLNVADISCPDLCRHNSDPSRYIRWILEHYCFGPQLTAPETCNNQALQPTTHPDAFQPPLNMTVEAFESSWIDYEGLQLASHNSLFAWQWEVKYDPTGVPNATATYKCPTKAGELGSFVVVNIVTVLSSFIFGHRQVLKRLTCKMLGDQDSSTKRWFLGGAISAGLSIGANAINARLIKQTQGFGTISVTQLVLLWCARPRLSWLGGFLAVVGDDKMNYTALGASCTIAEGILQAVASFYIGRTAHWGVMLGYLRKGHLDGIPGAADAKLMYAGSLLWLITIAFIFLPWSFLVLPSSKGKDADFASGAGGLFCFCMILPLIGQWLFWAGFVGLAGDRYVVSLFEKKKKKKLRKTPSLIRTSYCPPNLIHITTVWSLFSIVGELDQSS